MSDKVAMSLVEADVCFRIRVKGLVPTEYANDANYMEEWFEDKAFKEIDDASCDVDYDNQVDVDLPKDTATKYKFTTINKEIWKEIINKHKGENN